MFTLALGMPGPFEWLIIGAIGLLLFGKRLPEVGRSVGRTIVEFKKGMKEVEDEVHNIDSLPAPAARPQIAAQTQPTAYKFDPYTGKPLAPEAQPATPAQAPANQPQA